MCRWVDFLANVAGIDEPVAAIDADAAFYRRILEVNFFSAVVGTLSVLPGMARRRFGSVLNCSSDSVRTPIAHESAYVASKGALSAFTESIALEVRSFGVNVTSSTPALSTLRWRSGHSNEAWRALRRRFSARPSKSLPSRSTAWANVASRSMPPKLRP